VAVSVVVAPAHMLLLPAVIIGSGFTVTACIACTACSQ
jgi:hypothetical protein